MARTADWPWWHQYTGPDDYRVRELLRAILDLHGYYGDRETWLWRGQANSGQLLSPGVHTRIDRAGRTLDDDEVVRVTEELLQHARAARLDVHEGTALPDLALLARLQHHGAATPLLDISLDPLVALYMAVVSPSSADDSQDGVVFAIRKPQPHERTKIEPFDTRLFREVYRGLPTTRMALYSAPDVSDRLRIQRGHFLVSRVAHAHIKATIAASLENVGPTKTWLANRLASRGRSGRMVPATTDVAVFRVTAKFKAQLRSWLEERTGLTSDFVYPTVWHQPHSEMFARSHGRRSPL